MFEDAELCRSPPLRVNNRISHLAADQYLEIRRASILRTSALNSSELFPAQKND